jgi:hypothetical protein
MRWANHFDEILTTLAARQDIVDQMKSLIENEELHGKVFEGQGRKAAFRGILIDLIHRKLDLKESYEEMERHLNRAMSPYSSSNLVFSTGWAERSIRTQLSRFYNHAVMKLLLEKGQTDCYIPSSPDQNASSKCSIELVGGVHHIQPLLESLIEAYSNGNYKNKELKVPEHPYCSHVVRPIE